MKHLLIVALISLLPNLSFADTPLLSKAINGNHRSEENTQRDQYRNPAKTLTFFGIEPNHTVVEVWPGGGWYTEILAPYLKKQGRLIAAHYDYEDTQASYRPNSRKSFDQKMKDNKKVYGEVEVASLMFNQDNGELVKGATKSNSVDRVVTFRNAHGMFATGVLDSAMSHFFDILKPGGKLGFVQHQADPDQDWMSKNIGYIGRDYVIASALKAGFQLEAEAYFNNNPLDHKRHKEGVWQLPPSLRNAQSEEEKAHYLKIGESDRMTLLFVKP